MKNFSILYSPTVQWFSLSPVYDVVPNLWQREHILSIGGNTRHITHEDIFREGKHFSLSSQRSRQLLHEAVK